MIIDSPVERERASDSPEIETFDQEASSGEYESELVSETPVLATLEAERDDLSEYD